MKLAVNTTSWDMPAQQSFVWANLSRRFWVTLWKRNSFCTAHWSNKRFLQQEATGALQLPSGFFNYPQLGFVRQACILQRHSLLQSKCLESNEQRTCHPPANLSSRIAGEEFYSLLGLPWTEPVPPVNLLEGGILSGIWNKCSLASSF